MQRIMTMCCALTLCTTGLVAAQGGWDDRQPNVLSAGFGAHAGGLGVAYQRLLRPVPVALGVGAGVWGPAVQVQLTTAAQGWIPSLGSGGDEGRARMFIAIGAVAIRNRSHRYHGGGELFAEVGSQLWPAVEDRFYLDAGLALLWHAWGDDARWELSPALRIQAGVGF